jgi:LasA protease
MMQKNKPLLLLAGSVLLLTLAACLRDQPDIIVVTATFQPPTHSNLNTSFATPTMMPSVLNTTAIALSERTYVVQAGDTLSGIAIANGVSLNTLLALNSLVNPNALEVGQVILIPSPPSIVGSNFPILPDSRFVRATSGALFDVRGFIERQTGFARTATDTVGDKLLTAWQVIAQVSTEYSVDPRVLIAILEYRAGWLSNPAPIEQLKAYPLGAPASPFGFDRNGLYRQLAWASDQLNAGYYRHRQGLPIEIGFDDGTRIGIAPNLNSGSVAVQYMLSQFSNSVVWEREVAPEGIYATYARLFGDPFTDQILPLIPNGLVQPALTFPFPKGETWFFTGGPHGGWGSGSAWAAIDFAPPDDLNTVTSSCYVSSFFATAVAAGVIVRSEEGSVVLDLDSDGNEGTGWTILYLHIATQDRVAVGTSVNVGDRIGRPSCEGGVSTGTHIHVARRYNGEWIPVNCATCANATQLPPMTMDAWIVHGYTNQEYQGYMLRDDEQRVADQGRDNPLNRVSW